MIFVIISVIGHISITLYTILYIGITKTNSTLLGVFAMLLTNLFFSLGTFLGIGNINSTPKYDLSPIEYKVFTGIATLKERFVLAISDFVWGLINIRRLLLGLLIIIIETGVIKLIIYILSLF